LLWVKFSRDVCVLHESDMTVRVCICVCRRKFSWRAIQQLVEWSSICYIHCRLCYRYTEQRMASIQLCHVSEIRLPEWVLSYFYQLQPTPITSNISMPTCWPKGDDDDHDNLCVNNSSAMEWSLNGRSPYRPKQQAYLCMGRPPNPGTDKNYWIGLVRSWWKTTSEGNSNNLTLPVMPGIRIKYRDTHYTEMTESQYTNNS